MQPFAPFAPLYDVIFPLFYGPMEASILIALTLTGALSLLLTAAHLWQIKEWRWDRLWAHFLEEGILRQIFGALRPLIIALFLLGLWMRVLTIDQAVLGGLGVLATLTFVQTLLRRQHKPVWTQKAKTLTGLSFSLTIVLSIMLALSQDPASRIGLLLLPLVQPLLLACSLILITPLDRYLKQKIFRKAESLRKKYPELTVIGITGSVGKTTTKELLSHLLADKSPLVTPAYVNTDMGVAQWLIKVLKGGEGLIIAEMGAYRIGEIALLCRILQPQIGVITHVGMQHIALFGSEEAIFQAKSELTQSLPKDGHAFLNGDSAMTRRMAEACPCPVTIVSTGGVSDIEAYDVTETSHGISFTALNQHFDIPLHGTHNVANVLLAIAVGSHMRMMPQEIAVKLRSFRPPSHTFAMKKEGTVTILDDTHNASPASFQAAIAWAKEQPFKQKVLLASGLIELGEERERAHMELGTRARGLFSRVIFSNTRSGREFHKGYNGPVETLSKDTRPFEHDSLLVCCGRIPLSSINRLLP